MIHPFTLEEEKLFNFIKLFFFTKMIYFCH
ncbi:hypothetical protein Mgra_00002553 [Meloidogyne graminicola]|uniref:Uncharacterized protein n=1 Tax=Meloidogyne graminicola TaxID=189291 RepID=A0A8S9ZXT2_9BILA|nr:hypothetical protein Mgra_00002553 [Meloidogyne graminicola]